MIKKNFGRTLHRNRFREEAKKKLQQASDRTDEAAEMTMLSAINSIVTLAEDSQLSDSFYSDADRFICYLSERQNITRIQAVLLAIIVDSSAADNNTDFSDVAGYLGCNNVQVLQYKGEIDDLVKRGMLRMIRNKLRENCSYAASRTLLDSLVNNEPFHRKSYKESTGIAFFQHCYDITHLRFEDELSTELMIEEVGRLIDENPQLSYTKALRSIGMSAECEAIVTHMCRYLVLSGTDSLQIPKLANLFDDQHQRYDFEREMAESEHYLIREGWVENAFSEGFKDKDEVRLTEKARDRLLQGFEIRNAENPDCELIQSSSIVEKELYFDSHVKKMLDGLADLLDEQHYHGICERLRRKGLRQGFACLFYGVPGTGKTESALQLAHKTGRDIMQVNISELKSMWVGQSERNIKSLFDRYRSVAKHSKRIPILLFNEADGIIGKRKESADRSVDKMENSIQNIILQEMENLEGIMIATTNLVQNMDAAFERRFLYKVKFEKPELAQRTKIWQSMMPELTETAASRLATHYDFSGGQIENVTRKCGIEGILYGDDYVTEERIEQYCRDEVLDTKRGTRIGFH